MPRALEPGASFSHYRVVAALGAGGMGEVYKAHDSNLDRVVALKILPPELVKNDDRVRRFVQEAKSASSLNHPNIVTIHEIGQAAISGASSTPPLHFIAMELIEGLTLKEKIHREHVDLKTLLVWLAQVAEALGKAHASGIVHRDLKPENVMVTRDGYAKVLDFGLAKLSVRKGAEEASTAPTEAREVTREGAILGTVAYMAPEQVQGKLVDHRADIFAFGCMLYEAATRRRAFQADSDIDVMHMIVHDKPPAIEEIDPTIPAELRRMIRRCLAKDPEKRYQSMKDLAMELADIAAEYDELSAVAAEKTSASLSGPGIVARVPRRFFWGGLVGAGVLLLAGVLSLVTWLRAPEAVQAPGRLETMQIQRITTTGRVGYAAISPDGRYLAYTTRDEDLSYRLVLLQVSTRSEATLVGPSPNVLTRPTFSPDGDTVFFTHYDGPLGGAATLYSVSLVGGSPLKVAFDVDTPVAFSPDGRRMAFGRGLLDTRETAILVAGVDGKNEISIGRCGWGAFGWNHASPAWTPDGTKVLAAMALFEGAPQNQVVEIDVGTGKRRVVGEPWLRIAHLQALPDGSAAIVAGAPLDGGGMQLWIQPLDGGSASRITNDLFRYFAAGLTSDGQTLASIQGAGGSTIFKSDLDDEAGGRPVGRELANETITSLSVASNGVIAFATFDGRTENVWIAGGDGQPKRLTSERSLLPRITDDGSTIFFETWRPGAVPAVSRMAADGSGIEQLPMPPGEILRGVSRDGRKLLFFNPSRRTLRAGEVGNPGTIVATGVDVSWADYSPSGDRIAYFYFEPGAQVRRRVVVIPASGGDSLEEFLIAGSAGSSARQFDWTPSGNAIAYLRTDGNATNIWVKPLGGGAARQVTRFEEGTFSVWAWQDERTIIYSRPRFTSDAVLITNFR